MKAAPDGFGAGIFSFSCLHPDVSESGFSDPAQEDIFGPLEKKNLDT
jgi:hypothetical protein